MRKWMAFASALLFYASILPWMAQAEYFNIRARNITGDSTGSISGFTIDNSLINIDNTYKLSAPFYLVTKHGVTTDNVETTTTLQAALDNAYSLGMTAVMPAGDYKISSKLVIKGNLWAPDATIWVTGSPAVAVEVSTGSSTNPTDYIIDKNFIYLPNIVNVDKPSTGWAGQGTGVRIVNLYSCDVHLNLIKNFDTNLLITSYGPTMNGYNNYYIGNLSNGKINLKIAPGDGTSAVNENNFYGGRYSHYSVEGDNVTGVRHIYIDNTYSIPNNNAFWKPSLEGDVPEYHAEIRGSYNYIYNGRWESTHPTVYFNGINGNQGSGNVIFHGYNAQGIAFTSSATSVNNDVFSYDAWKHTGTHIAARNGSSSGYPSLIVYDATTDPLTAAYLTDYSVAIGAVYSDFKQKGDSTPRLRINASTGQVVFGGGGTLNVNFYKPAFNVPAVTIDSGFFAHTKISHTDNSTSPTVSGGNYHLINNGGATTIDSFTGGYVGQEIIIACGDNTTVFSGATLKTSAAFTCTLNDTIRFINDGTNWLELSRSVN